VRKQHRGIQTSRKAHCRLPYWHFVFYWKQNRIWTRHRRSIRLKPQLLFASLDILHHHDNLSQHMVDAETTKHYYSYLSLFVHCERIIVAVLPNGRDWCQSLRVLCSFISEEEGEYKW